MKSQTIFNYCYSNMQMGLGLGLCVRMVGNRNVQIQKGTSAHNVTITIYVLQFPKKTGDVSIDYS
jgi:hypothetical protein